MVAHNTGSTVTCSVIKLAYYNLKLYELEIYDLIVAKVALKVYRYRYRHRGKSPFTYRLLTELKIPLPYISDEPVFIKALLQQDVLSREWSGECESETGGRESGENLSRVMKT